MDIPLGFLYKKFTKNINGEKRTVHESLFDLLRYRRMQNDRNILPMDMYTKSIQTVKVLLSPNLHKRQLSVIKFKYRKKIF